MMDERGMIESLNETNLPEILEIIGQHPLANITLIADCTQLKKWCDVRILREEDEITAIFSLYKDLDFLAGAFWTTDSESLGRLLESYKLKNQELVVICTTEQVDIIEPLSKSLEPIQERQMVADRETELASWGEGNPRRVTMKNAEQLKELYEICGTPAWTPNALELGPFYTIRDDKGDFVSVAGVHYVTPYGTEVGNVATRPDSRRRGLASKCVHAVANDVLQTSELVVIHFFEENQGARDLYERMGFHYSEVDPVFFTKLTLK